MRDLTTPTETSRVGGMNKTTADKITIVNTFPNVLNFWNDTDADIHVSFVERGQAPVEYEVIAPGEVVDVPPCGFVFRVSQHFDDVETAGVPECITTQCRELTDHKHVGGVFADLEEYLEEYEITDAVFAGSHITRTHYSDDFVAKFDAPLLTPRRITRNLARERGVPTNETYHYLGQWEAS
jgi:hypothetical protein